MGSKFDPDSYLRYRPFYPPETFAGLRESLLARGFVEPFRIADVGCGTGHSAVSLLRAGVRAEVVALDPDAAMLEEARRLTTGQPVELRLGSGEETGLASESLVAVTVGSALHWMDLDRTREELARVLRPRGLARIFEYQFPKARELPELSEWIRRQFNLLWKAPGQKPRGDLAQLTRTLETDGRFRPVAEAKPAMVLELGPDELAGLLLSQSRVLHFEATLDEAGAARFRTDVREKLRDAMRDRPAWAFDFRLAWRELERV